MGDNIYDSPRLQETSIIHNHLNNIEFNMTPEQKWRAEAIRFLVSHDWAEWKIERYDNERLIRLIEDQLRDTTSQANYLTSEYIINVKPQKETPQHIAEIKSQKDLS